MARKEKNNIEYFPHSVHHGKKMFCLRSKYKNDGYAVWFMLLEQLGKAENHYLDLKDDIQLIYLSSELMVDEVVLIDIINMLVKLDVFDSELWNKERILFNIEFVESVSDAYKKRNNECIDKNTLLLLLEAKGRWKLDKSNPKLNNRTLKVEEIHKEKKRKEKERKENLLNDSLSLKVQEIINRFDETNFENTERTFESTKEKIKLRLIEFLEIEQITEQFENRPKGEVLKHFRNWMNYNPPVKSKRKVTDSVPWLTKDITGLVKPDDTLKQKRQDRWDDFEKRRETNPNAVY